MLIYLNNKNKVVIMNTSDHAKTATSIFYIYFGPYYFIPLSQETTFGTGIPKLSHNSKMYMYSANLKQG